MHRAEEHCAVQHWIVRYSAGHKLPAADSLCHSDDQRTLRLSVWNLHGKRGKMKLKSEMKTLWNTDFREIQLWVVVFITYSRCESLAADWRSLLED